MGSPRLTGKLTRACALVVLKARAGVNLSTGAIRRETFAEAEARGISTANLAQICGYLRSMAREPKPREDGGTLVYIAGKPKPGGTGLSKGHYRFDLALIARPAPARPDGKGILARVDGIVARIHDALAELETLKANIINRGIDAPQASLPIDIPEREKPHA